MKTIYICKKCKTALSEEGRGKIKFQEDGLCVDCCKDKPHMTLDDRARLEEIFDLYKELV